jgi:hypothetical protein
VALLLYAILTSLFTIYWIILLVDCFRLKALTRKTRTLWIILIVLGGPPTGALIYHSARSSLLKAATIGKKQGI